MGKCLLVPSLRRGHNFRPGSDGCPAPEGLAGSTVTAATRSDSPRILRLAHLPGGRRKTFKTAAHHQVADPGWPKTTPRTTRPRLKAARAPGAAGDRALAE